MYSIKSSATRCSVSVFLVALVTTLSVAQLPEDVEVVPFYNQDIINFEGRKPIEMHEVPGLPKHFFVLDMMGYLYVLYPKDGDYEKREIADFHERVQYHLYNEYGATSMAFHPDFSENRKFYIIYQGHNAEHSIAPEGQWRGYGGEMALEEWTASGEMLDEVMYDRTILTYDHWEGAGVSGIAFGPEGYLYVTFNDYGRDSWDLTHWARKVLRIDIDRTEDGREYAIPDDNPFYNDPDEEVKKEIWAYGFRNGWKISFDEMTGDLYLGDIGQSAYEELNIILPGRNYGWGDGGDGEGPATHGFSGNCNASPGCYGYICGEMDCSRFEPPAYAFPYHSWSGIGMKSITPGLVYRGNPESMFYGWHLFADEYTDRLAAFKQGEEPVVIGDVARISYRKDHDGIVHFTRDSEWNVYVVFLGFTGDYQIYRLEHEELEPYVIEGCKDSTYEEYNPEATLHVQDLCQTVGTAAEMSGRHHVSPTPELIVHIQGQSTDIEDDNRRIYHLNGSSIKSQNDLTRLSTGVYFRK
jgi:hypothetical protein